MHHPDDMTLDPDRIDGYDIIEPGWRHAIALRSNIVSKITPTPSPLS